MMKWQNLLMSVLIIASTVSCSSLESSPSRSFITPEKTEQIRAPEVPINKDEAFFPLRYREDGTILPSYQWKECVKRFIVCIKWQKKIVYFEDLSWFHANEFGLTKRRKQ